MTFDVGGTLIDPWPSVGDVYAAVAQEFRLEAPSPELLNIRFRAAWKAKSQFDYSLPAWAELVKSTFQDFSGRFNVTGPLFQKIYDRFRDPSVWRVYPDVLPTLLELRHRGFLLGIISNWDDRLRPLLEDLRLHRYFFHIEVSADSGFSKPASQIYKRAGAAFGLPAHEILHIGDGHDEDFVGAQASGLRALHLKRGGGRNELEAIGDLSEVVARISRDQVESLGDQRS